MEDPFFLYVNDTAQREACIYWWMRGSCVWQPSMSQWGHDLLEETLLLSFYMYFLIAWSLEHYKPSVIYFHYTGEKADITVASVFKTKQPKNLDGYKH